MGGRGQSLRSGMTGWSRLILGWTINQMTDEGWLNAEDWGLRTINVLNRTVNFINKTVNALNENKIPCIKWFFLPTLICFQEINWKLFVFSLNYHILFYVQRWEHTYTPHMNRKIFGSFKSVCMAHSNLGNKCTWNMFFVCYAYIKYSLINIFFCYLKSPCRFIWLDIVCCHVKSYSFAFSKGKCSYQSRHHKNMRL